MMKKIITVIICIMLMLCVTGCRTESTENDIAFSINGEVDTGEISIFIDEETGVNYVCYHSAYKGGICPRYNADGTLYVKAGEQE